MPRPRSQPEPVRWSPASCKTHRIIDYLSAQAARKLVNRREQISLSRARLAASGNNRVRKIRANAATAAIASMGRSPNLSWRAGTKKTPTNAPSLPTPADRPTGGQVNAPPREAFAPCH